MARMLLRRGGTVVSVHTFAAFPYARSMGIAQICTSQSTARSRASTLRVSLGSHEKHHRSNPEGLRSLQERLNLFWSSGLHVYILLQGYCNFLNISLLVYQLNYTCFSKDTLRVYRM